VTEADVTKADIKEANITAAYVTEADAWQNQKLQRKILETQKLHYRVTLQRQNTETNIPRKGILGSQSQFPHSCVFERFIYSHDRSAYSAGGNM
jgi:hypothetical protein